VAEADEDHESFPNCTCLDVIYFLVKVRLKRIDDVETGFLAPEGILHMLGGHVQTLEFIELLYEASGVYYEVVG
jgi:hypothetical protein